MNRLPAFSPALKQFGEPGVFVAEKGDDPLARLCG